MANNVPKPELLNIRQLAKRWDCSKGDILRCASLMQLELGVLSEDWLLEKGDYKNAGENKWDQVPIEEINSNNEYYLLLKPNILDLKKGNPVFLSEFKTADNGYIRLSSRHSGHIKITQEDLLASIHEVKKLEDSDYFSVLYLLIDQTVMPEVWKKLEDTDNDWNFASSLINGISSWGMSERKPPSENYKLYISAQKHLKGFLNEMKQSSDLLFNYQFCFERAIRNAHEERIFFENAEKPDMKNIHFMKLVENIIEQTDTWKKSDFSRRKNTNFPRKMQEKSAYRTYLVNTVYETLQKTYQNSSFDLVSKIINIMLPDDKEVGFDAVHARNVKK